MIEPSDVRTSPNAVHAAFKDLIALTQQSGLIDHIRKLNYEWTNGTFNRHSQLGTLFVQHGLVRDLDDTVILDRLGQLIYSRIALQFDLEKQNISRIGNLGNFKLLRIGKNSAVYSAEHLLLGTKSILKIVRPGASNNISDSLRLISRIDPDVCIVKPNDIFDISLLDVLGNSVTVKCILFPRVEGMNLKDFLSQKNSFLNSYIVSAFISQVGQALYELERVGAYHGDLHSNNIIVHEAPGHGIRFSVIDVSFDSMGSISPSECRNDDLMRFKSHISHLLAVQKSFIKGISIRKYIGTDQYLRIRQILSTEADTFRQIMAIFRDRSEFESFVQEKERFIKAQFGSPDTFRLQRYEEITDPAMAVRLFVPFDEIMTSVREFANVFVSGNRGSGKSTYLASLAFFPSVEKPTVNFREIFGVYFPCRQGEFRPVGNLSSTLDGTNEPISNPTETHAVEQMVVVKIIRRTLEMIDQGILRGVISNPQNFDILRTFLNSFLPGAGLISVNQELLPELKNIVSTMIRVELETVDHRANGILPFGRASISDLMRFFLVVRETFSELSRSQFHILFDDAGAPFVPRVIQRVFNDMMLNSNPIFCVKVSAEKYTFEFISSHGKILEVGHDYFSYDISSILFIGTKTLGLPRDQLEVYFRKIVEQRLMYFEFASHSIIDYVGDDVNILESLLTRLSVSAKNAYYGGWSAIWNIADRTPRNLLEIVSEIFSVDGTTERSEPRVISTRNQDRAIRTISDKRLKALSQIPGTVTLNGTTNSLGRVLFNVTTTIGSTFRIYLLEEGGKKQKRQHLAIERNDLSTLHPDAEFVLHKLVTYGVLDETKEGYARDDRIKKPFYVLNRIFCPAFNIGYRRDDHLRLSRRKFEMLLLKPDLFMKDGTSRLQKQYIAGNGRGKDDLFGYVDES